MLLLLLPLVLLLLLLVLLLLLLVLLLVLLLLLLVLLLLLLVVLLLLLFAAALVRGAPCSKGEAAAVINIFICIEGFCSVRCMQRCCSLFLVECSVLLLLLLSCC